jgi:hypothetical protein
MLVIVRSQRYTNMYGCAEHGFITRLSQERIFGTGTGLPSMSENKKNLFVFSFINFLDETIF